MLSVILTGSLAFIITFLAIPAIMKVAKEKKLFDLPDARKLHTSPIASLGGIGIFFGILSFLPVDHFRETAFRNTIFLCFRYCDIFSGVKG